LARFPTIPSNLSASTLASGQAPSSTAWTRSNARQRSAGSSSSSRRRASSVAVRGTPKSKLNVAITLSCVKVFSSVLDMKDYQEWVKASLIDK
jgi:hypothetical protein